MLTNPMTVGVLFTALWILFALPAGVLLILCFLKTRISGFLWLFASVVLWPVVQRILTTAVSIAIPSLMANRGLTSSSYLSSFMLLSLAQTAIGGILLLVSCVILYRELLQRIAPPPAPPPTEA